MPFDSQPHLTGEHVELRPLRADDFVVLARAASDPLIWEQHPDDRHLPGPFREFFDGHLASGGALLISDRTTGEVLGTSRFQGFDNDASGIEIGWTFLVRSRWGGPTNGEVKRLMIEHAFRYVENVLFFVHPDNIRSQAAVEKIGGVREEPRPNRHGLVRAVFRIRRDDFAS